MAKLGHPDGEINLTKGAASTGIIQIVSMPLKLRLTDAISSDR